MHWTLQYPGQLYVEVTFNFEKCKQHLAHGSNIFICTHMYICILLLCVSEDSIKNQNFRIRDFTSAFVYAPEDRFSKSCIDNTWFCKTSVSGHKLAWKHLAFQTRCIVQMPGISKMLGGTLNVEVYAMDVHVWYIYVPGICTCPIYSMYISHKRLTLLISALLRIGKWLYLGQGVACIFRSWKWLPHSTAQDELRLQNVNGSLQTNTCRLAATKKNCATMSLSCQHCRTILASCKRNQPNAYHSDYQNHEDASVGLDSFSQCFTLQGKASQRKQHLPRSNIFLEAAFSNECEEALHMYMDTHENIHLSMDVFPPWHMYMCDILCVYYW